MRMCSFDGRSRTNTAASLTALYLTLGVEGKGRLGRLVVLLLMEQKRGWSLMISCARATRGLRRMGWAAWSSSCSRNAYDRNVLVRRAHSRNNQATLEQSMRLGICAE